MPSASTVVVILFIVAFIVLLLQCLSEFELPTLRKTRCHGSVSPAACPAHRRSSNRHRPVCPRRQIGGFIRAQEDRGADISSSRLGRPTGILAATARGTRRRHSGPPYARLNRARRDHVHGTPRGATSRAMARMAVSCADERGIGDGLGTRPGRHDAARGHDATPSTLRHRRDESAQSAISEAKFAVKWRARWSSRRVLPRRACSIAALAIRCRQARTRS